MIISGDKGEREDWKCSTKRIRSRDAHQYKACYRANN